MKLTYADELGCMYVDHYSVAMCVCMYVCLSAMHLLVESIIAIDEHSSVTNLFYFYDPDLIHEQMITRSANRIM